MLRVRPGAALQAEDGSLVVGPAAVERILFNPATPEVEHEPWPLAGIEVVGDPPKETVVPRSFVSRGRVEGWLDLEGEEVVHRPGGPADDPWRRTHTFIHAKAIVLKTVDGDVRYRVTKNPDKFVAGDHRAKVTDEIYAAGETEVVWTYHLKLEKA